MKRENVKTRADLAEYLEQELINKKPDLDEEQRLKILGAVFSTVKTDAGVKGFLDGYSS